MAVRKSPPRYRVGRVSYFQHHASWYLYYRDDFGKPQRVRVGTDREAAERAAALKNAELVTGSALSVRSPAPQAVETPWTDGIDRRAFSTAFAGFVTGLSELFKGVSLMPLPAAPAAIAVAAAPHLPLLTVVALRQLYLDHHEHVNGSALATITRYSSATKYLADYAVAAAVDYAQLISATSFVKHLRSLEVPPNGHANSPCKPLTDKGIKFILETCSAMYRYGIQQKHLPRDFENPFASLHLRQMKVKDAKQIFVFNAADELRFLEHANAWAFGVNFTLAKTGLRPGELVHALIEDVDLVEGWLHVRGKSELGWHVKTGTDRAVPLAPEVVSVLKQVIGDRTSGPLFWRVKLSPANPPAVIGNRKRLGEIARERLDKRRRELGAKLSRREEARVVATVWQWMLNMPHCVACLQFVFDLATAPAAF